VPQQESAHLYSHLTNEALAARHDDILPLPTSKTASRSPRGVGGARRAQAVESRRKRCVLSLQEVRAALQQPREAGAAGGGRKEKEDKAEAVWGRIEGLAVRAMLSAEDRLVLYRERLLQQEGQVFELLGMDILLDSRLRPWLLKITDTVPNLQAETNLKYAMKERMVMDMLQLVRGGLEGAGNSTDSTSPLPADLLMKQEFGVKLERMERRWGVISPQTRQMLYKYEAEQFHKGGFKTLLPDVEEGSAGAQMEKYMMRYSDVTLRRWLTLDR